MMKISKEEAMELMSQGFQFADVHTGSNGVLHRTHSHHKTYYMTESIKALDALVLIREKAFGR